MTGGMGFRACSAQRQSEAGHVRFGSKADIEASVPYVRFTPQSGHWLKSLMATTKDGEFTHSTAAKKTGA